MIREFLASWPLFHHAYLAGWLIAILLSMVGVLVVARGQIFLGAAVAEASTLGIAFGLWLGSLGYFPDAEWIESDAFLSASAGAFSLLAAILTGNAAGGRGANEAATGWVFLAAGSLAILLVSHTAHGVEEIHRVLAASTIIGSSGPEVALLAVLTAGVGLWLWRCRRAILLVITDEDMAQAVGLNVRAWNMGLCCLLGVTVGLSLRAAGLFYTFGCLTLPALAAANLCRSALSVFAVAPVIALTSSVAAFVLAHHYDQPPGQMAVAVQCAVAAAAWLWRRARAG